MDNFWSPSSSSQSPSVCVTLCVCPTQGPIHRRSWDHHAPWTASPPHRPRGTFPPAQHNAELVSTRSQTLAISQIAVLKKSLRSKMLVNKSLLLLWFTTFLRTLRANFSTLLRLWGTADMVEPVPFRGRPASPQSVRGGGQHFTWQQKSREKYNAWLFIKAGKGSSERPEKCPKHVREPSSVRLWQRGGEGSQGPLGRRFCGQGRARRAGWAVRWARPCVPSLNSSKRLTFCTLRFTSPAKGKT